MSELAAPAPSLDKPSGFSLPRELPVRWLVVLIGLIAAMQLSMALGRSINWDEFWFYSQVEVVARGEFIIPLQTIHTRLFAWLPGLPGLPGSEIDHILTARLVMWACALVTAGGIYLTAEKFVDRSTALLAVAAYMGAGYVLQHSIAFRVDPMVTALLTSALAIAARTRLSAPAIVALGALIGLAAMVTIKFVLWAPAFAGIALWRWHEEGFDWRYVVRWVAAGVVSLAVFALIYWLHASGSGSEAQASATGALGSSAGRMFGLFPSPHFDIVQKGAVTAIPLLAAAILVPFAVWRSDLANVRKAAILLMWAMLLTPAYYYNSYPYFYVFILPPVAIACAFSLPLVTSRYGQTVVAGAILLSAAGIWAVDKRGVTDHQREVVSAVHEVFPKPVAYIDCCGMIASFSKVNQFRTQWGVAMYLESNRPLILESMVEQPVPLLLDNNKEFSRAMDGIATETFHPQDIEAMRSTYIRHWGDIFLAGREIGPGESLQWQVLVPGTYTVEGPLLVDGIAHDAGAFVELERGIATLENIGNAPAKIVWGRNPALPTSNPPPAYWTAF